ncbi:peptidase [Neoasaia chiangmaiensis]|nr:prolyl oligopeptidase family serine peptidase [Neoasaia chiangmaiensis]GEN15700.1 peptidase [Neoasaia chiangmaiensis]
MFILKVMSDPARSSSRSAGFWSSWVTPELVAGRTIGLSDLQVAGDRVYWLETRPQEGRVMLVSCDAGVEGRPRDELPPARDVGSSVHEYGGGGYAVAPDGRLVISDRRENGVWLRDGDGSWHRLGGASGSRYADFAFDPAGDGVFCVCEAHDGPGEPVASVMWFGHDGVARVLASGADFYAAPRPSPDGGFLAWIEWDHPDMPWDATRLRLASLARPGDGLRLAEARCLMADVPASSIVEPVWTPDGGLLANSDALGGWRPVRFDRRDDWRGEWLPDPRAEVGLPHWIFGQRTLAPLPDGRLLALGIRDGLNNVLLLEDGVWRDVALGAPVWCPLPVGHDFAWIDAPPDRPSAVAVGRPGMPLRRVRAALALPDGVVAADIAVPSPLVFPTAGGMRAHALFYRPASANASLAPDEKPPLVVMAHGGPTGRANPAFSFKVQWWTSRGFAVLDVNYRGSTGFGRAYRQALDGAWGVADVEDCLHAVAYVLEEGWADPARVVIRGSSAGGLTVLQCLARSRLFAAGTSLYGVTDLRALAQETHKFEARYLDRLIGPYPGAEAVYLARSPVTHAGGISAPVLFLHGDQDRVVPLGQAEQMVALLLGQGNRAEMHVYPEEGHGFRQQATLMDSFEREAAFYRDIFTAAG